MNNLHHMTTWRDLGDLGQRELAVDFRHYAGRRATNWEPAEPASVEIVSIRFLKTCVMDLMSKDALESITEDCFDWIAGEDSYQADCKIKEMKEERLAA